MHFLIRHIQCAFGSSCAVSQHYQSRWGMQIVSAETSLGQLLPSLLLHCMLAANTCLLKALLLIAWFADCCRLL